MIVPDQSSHSEESPSDVCRMISEFSLQSSCNAIMNQQLPKPNGMGDSSIHFSDLGQLQINNIPDDKRKAGSWDKHDSMHTTTRRCNRNAIESINDSRQWNHLDSVHSIKTMTWENSYNSKAVEQHKSLNISDLGLQSSNSSYNDSSCSFASFGEASLSDNVGNPSETNATKTSIFSASKSFTLSFEEDEQLPRKQHSQRQLMTRGSSYRSCSVSLSRIQEA